MGRILYVRRAPASRVLLPASGHAEDLIDKLPRRRDMEVTLTVKQAADAHRLYFEICHRVAKLLNACGMEGEDRATVDSRYRVEAGICTLQPASPGTRRTTGVGMIAIPRSISFAKMTPWDFSRFLDRCIAFTISELLPRLPDSELHIAVGDLLDESKRRAYKMEKESA